MKNRIIYYSLFIFLSIFLLFACQTDLQDVVEKDNFAIEKAFTVEEAKRGFWKIMGILVTQELQEMMKETLIGKKELRNRLRLQKVSKRLWFFQ